MARVMDVYGYVDSLAEFHTQESFDNAGFLVGRAQQPVARILVALDINMTVIEEAIETGVDLIVSHHPVIFTPLRVVTDTFADSNRVLMLAEHGISVICAHTNLDSAQDGVNDVLARSLGLDNIRQLKQSGVDSQGRPYGIGRIGNLVDESCSETIAFANYVKSTLRAGCVRYHDAGRPVSIVAVGGGSCGNMLKDVVAAGCDTFVTSDIKHDIFLDAADLGINLIDAGHFATEDVICQPLVSALKTAFPELVVTKSKRLGEVFSCL